MNRIDDLYDAAHSRIGSHAFFTSGNATYEDIYHIIIRLRAAEKDAARYRWLCSQPWFECEAEWNLPINLHADNYDFSQVIGAEIDKAMKENGDE